MVTSVANIEPLNRSILHSSLGKGFTGERSDGEYCDRVCDVFKALHRRQPLGQYLQVAPTPSSPNRQRHNTIDSRSYLTIFGIMMFRGKLVSILKLQNSVSSTR